MTFIAYENWNPRDESRALVYIANEIIGEYRDEGYILTLRQLYYQFVARGHIENSEKSYKNLGKIITKARMAGMISWQAIEDRNRGHKQYWYDEDYMNPIKAMPDYIRFDRWARQDHYVEVWVEKEALGNVISRACQPYLVPYMSCKGYLSASEAWRAGRRIREKLAEGKRCVVVHLGDHDPSGIDMTRDNRDRLWTFSESPMVKVERIALNMDQVEEYNPPPNPAKTTDSRSDWYISKYGEISWELDALEPGYLVNLIQNKIEGFIDSDKWNAVGEEEEKHKALLRRVYDNWDLIYPMVEVEDEYGE